MTSYLTTFANNILGLEPLAAGAQKGMRPLEFQNEGGRSSSIDPSPMRPSPMRPDTGSKPRRSVEDDSARTGFSLSTCHEQATTIRVGRRTIGRHGTTQCEYSSGDSFEDVQAATEAFEDKYGLGSTSKGNLLLRGMYNLLASVIPPRLPQSSSEIAHGAESGFFGDFLAYAPASP